MGFMEWVSEFSLPGTESECNALKTGNDPKPVQWDAVADKCSFFVSTDEARLGMSNCTAGQMFDMSNNTCSEKVVDTSCGAGMYRATEDGECISVPSGNFDQATLVTMGECGGMTTENGTHSWVDNACSLSCNEGYTLNSDGTVCEAKTEAETEAETDDSTEAFSNIMRNLSDRDILMLIVIVGLMYRYRKEIKKALYFNGKH